MTQSNSRRDFLRCSAAVVGAGIATRQVAGRQGTRMPERLRGGIIGATGRGDYGHAVDVAFSKVPSLEIVAIADADDSGREKAMIRTAAQRGYADYREMLKMEKLDIVAICPRWLDQHHDMILAAAEAGCHIYMEKPFCPTLEQCDSAIAALARRRLKLAIAHISQYSPTLNFVQTLIKNGEIGEVLELRARGKEDQRGGGEDLWVLGSHLLGLMKSLAGEKAKSCYAVVTETGRPISKANVRDGAEGIGPLAGDHVSAVYTFPSGIQGYFSSKRGTGANPGRFAIQVLGSKGLIEMETGYLAKAHLLRDGSWSPGRSGKNWEPITSDGLGKAETRTGGNYEGGHIAAITNLVESIQQDRQPKCSAEDAREIVEMIAGVFESSRLGGPVDLPLKERGNPLDRLP